MRYAPEWRKLISPTIPSVEKDVEQLELLFIVDGRVKWYKCFIRRCGNFLIT